MTPEEKKLIPKEDIWMSTYTGRQFHYYSDNPNEIDIVDIAHALSGQPRYNAHTNYHYSVAQHVVLGLDYIKQKENDKKLWRSWLLHDAVEAYLPDVHTFLKYKWPDYIELSDHIENRIVQKFDLYGLHLPSIKEVDDRIKSNELIELMGRHQYLNFSPLPNLKLEEWSRDKAKVLFLEAYLSCL